MHHHPTETPPLQGRLALHNASFQDTTPGVFFQITQLSRRRRYPVHHNSPRSKGSAASQVTWWKTRYYTAPCVFHADVLRSETCSFQIKLDQYIQDPFVPIYSAPKPPSTALLLSGGPSQNHHHVIPVNLPRLALCLLLTAWWHLRCFRLYHSDHHWWGLISCPRSDFKISLGSGFRSFLDMYAAPGVVLGKPRQIKLFITPPELRVSHLRSQTGISFPKLHLFCCASSLFWYFPTRSTTEPFVPVPAHKQEVGKRISVLRSLPGPGAGAFLVSTPTRPGDNFI